MDAVAGLRGDVYDEAVALLGITDGGGLTPEACQGSLDLSALGEDTSATSRSFRAVTCCR